MASERGFPGTALVSVGCIAAAVAYGWHTGHGAGAVLDVVWIVLVLAVLEVSLSLDNAVVNAAILGDLDPVWRRRFLTWGVAISVVGARVAFPLAIVGLTADLPPVEALRLSLADPARYEAIMRQAHVSIAGFGGAFLLMVGLSYFLDPAKEAHWLGWPERRLRRIGGIRAAEISLPLAALALVAQGMPFGVAARFLIAGLIGMIAYTLMESLGTWMEGRQRGGRVGGAASGGLATFLYLNVLDASFSLDGVIGAFALTSNMVVIALGLTIGAVMVRHLTVTLVERDTLARYRWLEHGAFWAITALGAIMLISARIAIPDALTGLVSGAIIAASVISSMRGRR